MTHKLFHAVGIPLKISKDSKLSASGTGVFAGEKLSVDGHAHLDLHLFDSGSSPEIAEDEMAMNGNLTVSGTLKLTENVSNSDQKEE